MSFGSDLRLAPERAGLTTEMVDALDSFAAEGDLTGPLFAGHATPEPLARHIPFIIHPPPVPPAPMRAARGRVRLMLTVLALGAAGWGAYEYESTHPIDLDTIAAWASRLASAADAAMTAPATAPIEPLRLDPPAASSLASSEGVVSPAIDAKPDGGGNPSVPAANEIVRPPATLPESAGTFATVANPVRNVSGEWRVNTQTEASDSSVQSLQSHYEVTLKQDGDRVAGVGTKVTENEKGVGAAVKTPVSMSGGVAGDRLTLNVVELGTQPETRSKIVLMVNDAGTVRGRFSSSGAPSSGHIEAHRVAPAQ
jgi:hypothetical protein